MERARSNSASGNKAQCRTAVVVSILLLIALVHFFRAGTYLRGSMFRLYYSYFSDIIIPFGIYFLLCLDNVRAHFLKDWRARAVFVFSVASLTEVMQAFGVRLFGRTFDPIDFVMFGGGVLLAAFVDRLLLTRFLPCWSLSTK